MKILITGANGFLGQHLCAYFTSRNYEVVAVSRGPRTMPAQINVSYYSIDLTDKNAVANVLENEQPNVVIHAAAMSKPDECDANREACMQQNVGATKNLVEGIRDFSIHFIYISTDFIFGEDGPHSEDDVPAPLNFYGESKLQAEQLVSSSELMYNIVRPVFIYGTVWEGLRGSFLHWVKNNLEQGKKIKVVSDQQRTPTLANDICKGIAAIIENQAAGDFHLAGKDIVSPYEMAIKVAEVLSLDSSLIEKVTSETFPETVKRAKRSGLKIDKAINILNYQPVSFEEGVRITFNITA